MKSQKTLIFLLILVAVVIGYIVYQNTSNPQIAPIDVATTTEEMVDSLDKTINLAETNIKATEETTQLLAPIPDLARPIIVLAKLIPETEIIARAKIAELTKGLAMEPGLLASWLDLASYRKLIGDDIGAEEIWLFMTKQWSDNDVPYINLGNFYHYQTHDFTKSEVAFRKAISVKPNSIAPYIGMYELYALSYSNKASLADDILLEGLKNNPKNIFLLSTLAEYYTEQKDITSAKKYYEEALSEAIRIGDTKLQDQLKQRISTL